MELFRNEVEKILFQGLTFSIEIVNFSKIIIGQSTVDIFVNGSKEALTIDKQKIKII